MNKKEVTIKVEGKEWESALDKAFEKANKKVKIDGFRQGHAPKDVFLKKYGKGQYPGPTTPAWCGARCWEYRAA